MDPGFLVEYAPGWNVWVLPDFAVFVEVGVVQDGCKDVSKCSVCWC